MAEIAAGALAAEQAVTTTIEGGAVAAVAIAQPTMPLKASFERIGSAPTSDAPDSLGRSHHSVTYINNDLYIYGGLVGSSKLAGQEMHVLKLTSDSEATSPSEGQTSYKTIPPLSSAGADGPLPPARFGHTAVALPDGPQRKIIAVFGGSADPAGTSPLDEGGRIWLFDTDTLHWKHIDPVEKSRKHPGPRVLHAAVAGTGSSVIIHGGKDVSGTKTDTWHFNRVHQIWSQLPPLPTPSDSTASPESSSPPALTIAHDCLYLLTTVHDNLSMGLHQIDLAAATHVQEQQGESPSDFASITWNTVTIPTNPLTPSPSLKFDGSAFVPVFTGLGRVYLLHLMGAQTHFARSKPDQEPHYSSTIHALQLPSTLHSPASAKDSAREHIPHADSHRLEWHEVDVVPKEEGASNPTWLDTIEAGQQNVRATMSQAASAAGEWIKGRARAVSSATKDMHVAGADQPEPPPVLEDKEKENVAGMRELSLKSPTPESTSEISKGGADKDDLPLSTSVPHRIKPGTDADATQGRVSGKAHPGPRAWFGCTSMGEPRIGTMGSGEKPARVALWGGMNAKGEREGDGWVVTLKV